MKEWSIKKKRMVIGILMMYCFFSIVYTINFFIMALGSVSKLFLGLVAYHYFWVPSVLLILLSYHILTKVYKYEGDDK